MSDGLNVRVEDRSGSPRLCPICKEPAGESDGAPCTVCGAIVHPSCASEIGVCHPEGRVAAPQEHVAAAAPRAAGSPGAAQLVGCLVAMLVGVMGVVGLAVGTKGASPYTTRAQLQDLARKVVANRVLEITSADDPEHATLLEVYFGPGAGAKEFRFPNPRAILNTPGKTYVFEAGSGVPWASYQVARGGIYRIEIQGGLSGREEGGEYGFSSGLVSVRLAGDFLLESGEFHGELVLDGGYRVDGYPNRRLKVLGTLR